MRRNEPAGLPNDEVRGYCHFSGPCQGLTFQRAIRALENYGHFAEVTLIGRKLIAGLSGLKAFPVCFAPTTAEAHWVIHIVPAAAAEGGAPDPVFAAIAFGTGEKPGGAVARVTQEAVAAPGVTAAPGDPLAALDGFEVLATTGGYLGKDDFLAFIHNAEAGVKPVSMT